MKNIDIRESHFAESKANANIESFAPRTLSLNRSDWFVIKLIIESNSHHSSLIKLYTVNHKLPIVDNKKLIAYEYIVV